MIFLLEPFASAWKLKDPFFEVTKIEGEIYRTLKFTFNQETFYIKIHRGTSIREIIKNLISFRLPVIGARSEFNAVKRLHELGINTLDVVAFGEKGINPLTKESFIVTKNINPSTSLEDYCQNWKNSPPLYSEKKALIEEVAKMVQKEFMNPKFRIYTSTDVIGVEMGAALKNVMALAAGMNDGLGFGDNSKAALMTRGIAEMKRLGIAMGGKAETFAGLSGIGDLIVTCTSMHSRNRRAGILLGQGKSLEETLAEVKMVVEGVNTVQAACHLAEKYHVDLPITQAINDVLFHGKDTQTAVLELMTREGKSE